MKLDLRTFSPEQRKVLEECATSVMDRVETHYKVWAAPMKSRACITTQTNKLTRFGLNVSIFKSYLVQQKLAQICTTAETNVELVFLPDIDNDTILEKLFEYDKQTMENQEHRKAIRAKYRAEGVHK